MAETTARTRKTNATKRSTAAKKAAGTRAANRGAAARTTTARKAKATANRTATRTAADAKSELRTPLSRATGLAEKVVLVPVGAALVAREEAVATFEDLRSSYGTRTKARRELRRFERRGSSAVKGVTEPVKKNVELAGARIENAFVTGRTAATKTATSVQERIAARA
jgi:hypothetical protein